MKTPTLDKYHKQGVTLENYYVLPTCSPSRATFLTGRMPLHTGLTSKLTIKDAKGLPLRETLMPSLLRRQGYRCHAIGKWHLGHFRTEYTPTFRGFESFYGYYSGGEDYFQHRIESIYDMHRQPRPFCGPNCSHVAWEAVGVYSTKLFLHEAIRIIRRHKKQEPEKPLFLYQAWQNVHAPIQATKYFLHQFRSVKNRTRRIHAAMVSSVDNAIGQINDVLQQEGMLQNSVVVVTTDNGGAIHECKPNGASNYPLRGGKCSIWEGGTRGTALIYAPSFLPAGLVWPGLFHAADWLPTLLCAAGADSSFQAPKPLDGFNLWPALQQNLSSLRSEIYYGLSDIAVGRHGPGLRDAEGWKLILQGGGGVDDWSLPRRLRPRRRPRQSPKIYPLLFDLTSDPSETTDLSQTQPEITSRLGARLKHYRRQTVRPIRENKFCPKFSPRSSPSGEWMGPWCD
eukprot:s2313_g2.t1